MRIMLAGFLVMALALGGCGKRPRFLDPPDANAPPYPAHYPPPDSPGTHL
jgi:hypothetical protein